jgi:apolipoprotein N-acyltransferase
MVGQTRLRGVAAVASGFLFTWSYSLHPWWPVAWVAPIPLLVAVASVRWKAAVGLGAVTGAVASVSLVPYLVDLGGPVGAVSISALRAIQWAILAWAAWVARSRLPAPVGVFVMPALAAGFEVVIAGAWPHGSGGSLAYSQMDALPVIQVASLGGS